MSLLSIDGIDVFSTLVVFPHGQHLADHGLDRIVLDSSQQMADLGALFKATVAVLHQVLGNGVLLNVGIGITGPIPVLLLAAIGQVCKVGFHLVGQMIHVITVKVMGKQEVVQLAAFLLLLGRGGMKPRGRLPKHFKQDVPYCHHVDAEGVQKGPFSSRSAMAFADWPGRATCSSRIGAQAIASASKDG